MKKKYLLTLLAGLISSIMFAQTIQLIMSPNPSPYLSDWQNKTETARLIVNNTSQSSIDCKIKTQLFNGDDELVAETDFAKMPVLTLMPGISQFNAEDIYPLEAVKTYGNYFNSTSATGRIPDGNYRICTDLVDPIKGTPLTTQSPQCKMFRIIAYQAPVLIAPRENQIIPETESKGIFFRWTPVAPTPNYIVTYRLQIWEVSDGQTNVDALRYNWPIIEKDFRGILQTQWPIDFALPDEEMNYVWTITPLDNEGRNLVDGYGMAEPFGFKFKTEDITPPILSVKLQQPPPNQLRLSDLANFTLNNPTGKPIEVSIECKMTSQETKPILIIVIAILKQFTLPPGITKFSDITLKRGTIKYATEEWEHAFSPTGVIPTGDYEICVSVIDKEGKEIGKDCVEQKIESSACDDFTVKLMDPPPDDDDGNSGDTIIIGNIVIGGSGSNRNAPEFKAKSFRITLSNDLVIVKADEAPKGWTRTPSKFPPGSSSVIWTASSGDIPSDETDLGSIVFINVKSEPVSLQYEWLNKNGKVICKDSAIRYDVSNAGTVQSIKLISPTDGENITPEKQLNFIWEPLLLKATEPVTYRLKVWQLMEGQSPTQAMRVNQPIFTKDVKNTSIIWDYEVDGGIYPEITAFVWNVQALNHEGKPIGKNNGMSEPFGFSIIYPPPLSTGNPTQSIKLISPKNGETIMSEKELQFIWLPPVPVPPDEGIRDILPAPNTSIRFRLKIVEIRGDESPEEAMQNSESFFDVWVDLPDQEGEVIYKYPESAPKFEAGKKYAWAIQSEKKKDKDWDEAVGDLKSSISIFDRWGRK